MRKNITHSERHLSIISNKNLRVLGRYSLYPAIFVILYSFATAKRINDMVTNDAPNAAMTILVCFGLQYRGLVDAILFVITYNVLPAYKNFIVKTYRHFKSPKTHRSAYDLLGDEDSDSNMSFGTR